MSQLTKKALADALIKELQTKTIDKISIKDLTDQCGINRQTFYYHFTDIYALMEWTLKRYLIEKFQTQESNNTTTMDNIQYLISFLTDERRMLLNAYDNRNYIYYHQFLTNYLSPLIKARVMEEPLASQLAEEKINFIVTAYTYALVGLAIDWINRGAPNDMQLYLNDLSILLGEDYISNVLERFVNAQNS